MEEGMTAERWLEKGIDLGQSGRHGEAIFAFRQAVNINPEFAEAWYCLGIALGEMGRTEDELDAYDRAIRINPEYAAPWNNRGVVMERGGRHEEALDAYDRATGINPQFAEAWYNKGIVLGRLVRYEEALDAYNRATGINPEYTKAWKNKGITLIELDRDEEALEAYDRATEVNPQFAEAWSNKGDALDRLGRHEEAQTAYDRADELKPQAAEAIAEPTTIEPQAAEAIAESTTIEPQAAELRYSPQTGNEVKRLKQALDTYEKAIKADPQSAQAYSNSAEVLLNLGALEPAHTRANRATMLDDKLPSAQLLKGRIELEQKRYAEAGKSFARAIASDLGNPIPVIWDAYAKYLEAEATAKHNSSQYREQIAGAIRQLERACDLSGQDSKQVKAYSLYFLGCLHYKTRNMLEAKHTLQKCVELKAKSRIDSPARELLDNIWNYIIRPPLWRWWLGSPISRRRRRAVFSVISFFILALLVAHPFILAGLPTLPIDTALYVVLVLLLISLLALPGIERIRARDIEVEPPPPPATGTAFSPPTEAMKTKD